MNLTTIKIESVDCFWDGLFSDEELDQICEYCEQFPKETGTIGDAVKDEEFRKSTISWIGKNQDSDWFFSRIESAVNKLNSKFYGFDLYRLNHMQYTLYEKDQSHYSWHWDMYTGNSLENLNNTEQRKLSAVLQLSDANDYVGGDFEYNSGSIIQTAEKKKGLLITFPSFVIHRVVPVESGVRKTLVAWFTGPDWR